MKRADDAEARDFDPAALSDKAEVVVTRSAILGR